MQTLLQSLRLQRLRHFFQHHQTQLRVVQDLVMKQYKRQTSRWCISARQNFVTILAIQHEGAELSVKAARKRLHLVFLSQRRIEKLKYVGEAIQMKWD
mmetsp:Transcript_11810/g.15808  ORF Transcript_11810/g.15808 Transcript_11810/m.15808 type:complete len:98 (-) Transcript_11810:152-445(-)